MATRRLLIPLLIVLAVQASPSDRKKREDSNSVWYNLAKDELKEAMKVEDHIIKKKAKNIILFIGDGMGPSSWTAGRWYLSEITGKPIQETKLSWETLPFTAMSKTYNADAKVPDSAGTGTAILSGEKAWEGVIGLNENAARYDCDNYEGKELVTVLDYAHMRGKSTGIVTTARISHATPASSYAHVPNRGYEGDWQIPEECRGKVRDISQQLIEDNSFINVLFGGGRRSFRPNGTMDPEEGVPNRRIDGRDLIQEWVDKMKADNKKYKTVFGREDFDNIDVDEVEHVLGLMASTNIGYNAHYKDDKWGQPSHTEMMEKAIQILQKNDEGYFLLVEEGHIDYGHHYTQAHLAVDDTAALHRSVQRAMELTDPEETLIIVTADHSHSFTFSGHTKSKDTGIFEYDERMMGLDGKPYLMMGYLNGPGFYKHRTVNGDTVVDDEIPRRNINEFGNTYKEDTDFIYDAPIPVEYTTHGGEEVGIFARGPWAFLFHGVHEENYIGHVMMYAACLRDDIEADHCKDTPKQTPRLVPPESYKDLIWYHLALNDIEESLKLQDHINKNKAKNAIIFVGDGMGPSTVNGGRWYLSEQENTKIEETKLSWDTFPFLGLSKTYNVDNKVSDSAGTATAILSGGKVAEGVLGLKENIARGDCDAAAGNEVKSLLAYAKENGMSTGIVTTTSISDSTPAAGYAHSPDNTWEYDSEVPDNCRGKIRDISLQFAEDGTFLNVVFAGGRSGMLPNNTKDPEANLAGKRTDGRNLIDEWEATMKDDNKNYKIVYSQDDFNAIDVKNVEHVLGLMNYDDLGYSYQYKDDVSGQPTHAQMVKKAIDILSKNDKGYILFVEEGHIDIAHHQNMAHAALDETLALHKSVQVAKEETDPDDTLLLVTGDHSHTFMISGHTQHRDTGLFEMDSRLVGLDDKPYLMISYANGPGFKKHRTQNGDVMKEIPRKNPQSFGDEVKAIDFVFDAAVPLESAAHGGEDVAIYARGPWSFLFHSVHEENYIAHVVMHATCLGEYADANHCSAAVKPVVGMSVTFGLVIMIANLVA